MGLPKLTWGEMMEDNFQYTDSAALVKYLKTLSDEPYQKLQYKLIPGAENVLGVRVPKLRALAKQIAKGDWRRFLNGAQDACFEEIMLQGLVIGYAKMTPDETFARVADFVPKINNWEVCDVCCSTFKTAAKEKEKLFAFLQPYLKSQREFDLRFAVIMLMDYFITEEYIDRILKIYDEIRHDGYYVKMAVAWALSVCFVKYQDKTMRFLEQNSLDDWTFNKTLQKITESYRVDDNMKTIIRNMKRKGK